MKWQKNYCIFSPVWLWKLKNTFLDWERKAEFTSMWLWISRRIVKSSRVPRSCRFVTDGCGLHWGWFWNSYLTPENISNQQISRPKSLSKSYLTGGTDLNSGGSLRKKKIWETRVFLRKVKVFSLDRWYCSHRCNRSCWPQGHRHKRKWSTSQRRIVRVSQPIFRKSSCSSHHIINSFIKIPEKFEYILDFIPIQTCTYRKAFG